MTDFYLFFMSDFYSSNVLRLNFLVPFVPLELLQNVDVCTVTSSTSVMTPIFKIAFAAILFFWGFC